jgi:hypothetical protein
MKRREAIQLVSLSLGAYFSSPLAGNARAQLTSPTEGIVPSAAQEAFIAEVADVIIPTTDTPGAKAAGVEKFIIRVLKNCHQPDEQKRFYNGLSEFDAEITKRFSQPFSQLTDAQKKDALQSYASRNKSFFLRMKQLTVTGYFNSEIGATQALAYLPIPGRFQGSVPMEPNQKTWAL